MAIGLDCKQGAAGGDGDGEMLGLDEALRFCSVDRIDQVLEVFRALQTYSRSCASLL